MSFTRRNVFAGFAAAGLAGVAMPAVVSRAYAATPKKGGLLRMWIAEPVMLTGAFNSTGQIYEISGKLFDGLACYDFNLNPKPQLALSWDVSADGKSITFKLRPGVKWHDGKPFTASDVQFSALKVWKELHPRGRSTYRYLADVEVPDALTAIFKFERPSPYVMNSLASVESQILPRHLYEGTDILTNPANLKPIGTGPFKFKEWQRGQYIIFERNPDYWDAPKPYLDGVVMVIIPDAASRAVALEAGELDVAGAIPVPLADAHRLAALPTLEIPVQGSEALAFQAFMELNLRRPYFQDVRVRRAMYHAIDRNFVRKSIYFDFAKAATGPISYENAKFYTADVPQYEFSIAKANALLDEAGMKRQSDGLRFKITHDPLPAGDHFSRTGDYFKQQMAQLGIAVDIRNQDFPTYYRRVYKDYDFDTTSTGAFGLTDPTVGIQRFYWSKNIVPGVAFSNGSGYSSAEADKALEDAQTEVDPAKRAALFRDFQKIVMTDLPLFPIADARYITIKSKTVMNIEVDPLGAHGSFAEAYLAR
ncbi:ABC transporter substrate-binding protein [Bradyrhizobium sp. CCH5-F6]|jgi:peptide/nickel transport system substrate-binding protein|uniref:ABC transporter substrate-binding protein n=1 Tax=Bradyrhizobium sp. CCH5-F6 TaxID=1768753 RepID=UPI000769A921|nr:ABC transporter substrate-binding protein [Bradyrhizobium sp. CCH5-F6]